MKLNKKDLYNLQNLPYEDKKVLIMKTPAKMLSKLYVSLCTTKQIQDLFQEFNEIIQNKSKAQELGDPEYIKNLYLKKVIALVKALKRKRESYKVPKYIYDNYDSYV